MNVRIAIPCRNINAVCTIVFGAKPMTHPVHASVMVHTSVLVYVSVPLTHPVHASVMNVSFPLQLYISRRRVVCGFAGGLCI